MPSPASGSSRHHTKQRKEHRLPLGAPALQLIADIRARRGEIDPDDYVFPGRRPGQPLQQLRTCWEAVCKHAGLTDVRIYDLRHTFAAMGAGGGLGLPLIGRLLGHTQPRTTQRYAHLADDPLREAADKIARPSQGQGRVARSFGCGMAANEGGRPPPVAIRSWVPVAAKARELSQRSPPMVPPALLRALLTHERMRWVWVELSKRQGDGYLHPARRLKDRATIRKATLWRGCSLP